jgi:hypothetical protein
VGSFNTLKRLKTMISEKDIEDWIVYPEQALDKVKRGEYFFYRGKYCQLKKRNFFAFDVVDSNGVEFTLDFFTLVNPLKRRD